MGDKGVSDQEFRLLSEFDKENMYNDRLNSLVPHTHVPTELPNESLSYFTNNNYLVPPPFSAGPKIPEVNLKLSRLLPCIYNNHVHVFYFVLKFC